MVQCPETHLFCTSCMISYAETKLGEHDARIVCMDQSGCKLPFPESELRRFLTPKLLELYERVKQRKEIEAAGLEGLEECPFCEYKVVIENEQERLFRCENEACGAVTCRQCKKLVSVNLNLSVGSKFVSCASSLSALPYDHEYAMLPFIASGIAFLSQLSSPFHVS